MGSLERSVEFHEQAILELERQVSVVDSSVTMVKDMEQLLAQLQHLSYETKDKSLTIAGLGMKLETRVWDLQDFSTSVEVKQLSMAELHDDLEKRVLHVEQQVESRAMRASTLVSTLLRVVSRTWSSGVKPLLRASSIWNMVGAGAALAGSGIQILGGALAWNILKILVQVFARAVRTWIYGASFPHGLVSRSHVFGVWVLHLENRELDSSGDAVILWAHCLARQWIHVLRQCLVIWPSRVRCLGVACGVQKF